MALTFLDTVFEQYSSNPNGDFPATVGDAAWIAGGTFTDEAHSHDRDVFYAGIIRSLNECMAEGDGCGDVTAKSLVEDEPLAYREWERLLERVLSGPIEA